MPYPAGLGTITVTGEFAREDGTPTGTVTLYCDRWLIGPGDDVIVKPFNDFDDLDGSGQISITVPPCNKPGWGPTGWTYKVRMNIDGVIAWGTALVPYDAPGGAVDLADIINMDQATPTPGTSYILLASRGVPGGVAPLDGDGDVTDAEGNKITGGGGVTLPITIDDVIDLGTQLDSKLNIPVEPYITAAAIVNLVSIDTLNETVTDIDADLALKAALANPTFTGTVSGITKAMVGLPNVDNTSDANKPISTAVQAALDLINSRDNLLTVGEEILPRDDVAGEVALVSGVIYWSFFTARKTETINTLRNATGGTLAAGLTLARKGIYTTDGTTLTLVASSANDTAMWTAANTVYSTPLSAPWNKVAGQRYARAILAVGSTMPNLEGVNVRPNSVGLAPRIVGELSGQSNLPATQLESGLSTGFRRFQEIMLP